MSDQQCFYNKIRLLASIPPTKRISSLTEEDVYKICQYSAYSVISQLPTNLQNKITQYRQKQTGNSCLHIAAISSNKDVVRNFLQKNLVDPNYVNLEGNNALMTTFIQNQEAKAESIALMLIKKTELRTRNKSGKQAHQVPQVVMNQSRARILEIIKKEIAGK